MDKKISFLLVIFALLGIFLLGRGITGLVISETCCFPPNCSQENICDAADESGDMSSIYLGSFIILGSAVAFALVKRKAAFKN
ncbi:hypothetical protein JW707_02750 [Candidatus Woesearchaeota archaeon]|nr:hypothetical protein [Candidatus Woesearchaeota archaeon]